MYHIYFICKFHGRVNSKTKTNEKKNHEFCSFYSEQKKKIVPCKWLVKLRNCLKMCFYLTVAKWTRFDTITPDYERATRQTYFILFFVRFCFCSSFYFLLSLYSVNGYNVLNLLFATISWRLLQYATHSYLLHTNATSHFHHLFIYLFKFMNEHTLNGDSCNESQLFFFSIDKNNLHEKQ